MSIDMNKVYPNIPVDFPIWYYEAPLANFVDALDETELGFIKEFGNLTENCSYQVARLLNNFEQYEKSMVRMPLTLLTQEYSTLPSSMAAYLLGIKKESRDEQVMVACYPEESFNQMMYLGREDGRYIKADTRRQYMAQRERIYVMILSRVIINGINGYGRHYTFYTSSPAGLKKESAYFLSDECALKNPHLFWFGLNPAAINENTNGNIVFTKLMQWRALFFSSAIPSSLVFGKPIRPDKVFCLPKIDLVVNETVDHVSMTGEITRETKDCDRAFGDGEGLLNPNRFGKAVAQTRYLGTKILLVGYDIELYAESKGLEPVVTDVRQRKINLKETEWDALITPDGFKMLKPLGGWENAVSLARSFGLKEFFVCGIAREGKHIIKLSRQMTNTLFGLTDEELLRIIDPTIDRLNSHNTVEGAIKLLNEDNAAEKTGVAQMLDVYPEAIQLPEIQTLAAIKHQLAWCHANGGEIRVPGRMQYIVDDPQLMARGFLGMDIYDIKEDLLGKEEGFMSDLKPELLTILRSPHAYMEWATFRNIKNQDTEFWYPEHVIVESGRDINNYINKNDVDGDEGVVPEWSWLAEVVLDMRIKFDIVPLEYDALKGEGKPILTTRDGFYSQVIECIRICHQYNLVGRYSNLIAHIWADIQKVPETPEEARKLLHEAAFIAKKINEAVDSQKTYKMVMLPDAIVFALSKKPQNQRYFEAKRNENIGDGILNGPALTTYLAPKYDIEDALMPEGEGSVDRIGRLIRDRVSPVITIDTSSQQKFDWNLLIAKRAKIGKGQVIGALMSLVMTVGSPNNEKDQKVLTGLKAGEKIGLTDLVRLLYHLNAQNMGVFTKNEDNELVKSVHYVRQMDTINKVLCNFAVLNSSTLKGKSLQEVRSVVASVLADMLSMQNCKNRDLIPFVFEVFGDVYAKNIVYNRNMVKATTGTPVVSDNQEVSDSKGAPVQQ